MKFSLTYEGELRTGSGRGSDGMTAADRKQALREHFHQQLRRLWQVNSFLKGWGKKIDDYSYESMKKYVEENTPALDGARFVPLVSRTACVDCWIDFRILRPGHNMVNAPDIDNQVKVLFDGLKMPRTRDEMGQKHHASYNPLYVLLEDDGLVNRLTSTQDELLQPIHAKREVEKNDVRVLIDVHVRPQVPTAENVIFYSDDGARWDHRYYEGLPENLTRLGNAELKAVATQCIFRIRALSEAFSQWNNGRLQFHNRSDASEEERRAAWLAETDRMRRDGDAQRRIWQHNLWPKARAIKDEMSRRLSDEPRYPSDGSSVAIEHGMLAGVHPLGEAAAELEALVRRLA